MCSVGLRSLSPRVGPIESDDAWFLSRDVLFLVVLGDAFSLLINGFMMRAFLESTSRHEISLSLSLPPATSISKPFRVDLSRAHHAKCETFQKCLLSQSNRLYFRKINCLTKRQHIPMGFYELRDIMRGAFWMLFLLFAPVNRQLHRSQRQQRWKRATTKKMCIPTTKVFFQLHMNARHRK